jgi:hypothetical protein
MDNGESSLRITQVLQQNAYVFQSQEDTEPLETAQEFVGFAILVLNSSDRGMRHKSTSDNWTSLSSYITPESGSQGGLTVKSLVLLEMIPGKHPGIMYPGLV